MNPATDKIVLHTFKCRCANFNRIALHKVRALVCTRLEHVWKYYNELDRSNTR